LQEIFKVARKVYEEFQHSHNPPALPYPPSHTPVLGHRPYYYAFRYGPVAFLVLDLRGNRKIWDGQLLGPDQWAALKHWFQSKEAQDSKILFLVSSVPMIHLKKIIAKVLWISANYWNSVVDFLSRYARFLGRLRCDPTDVADQWSAHQNNEERRELFTLLFDGYIEKGKRQVFILGGDVHVGTVAKITDSASGQSIYQFTSSPISNKPAKFLDSFLKRFSSEFTFYLESGGRPVDVKIYRRYRQRNFGIVTVKLDTSPEITFRMYQEYEGKPDEIPI
jgi:hypothetical protein